VTVTLSVGKYELSPVALLLSLLAAGWLLVGLFLAPEGLVTDDEIIYVGMIHRFATAGSFVIENGFDVVPAESLRLTFLRPGPHGLVPQYPGGFAVLAAPFYLAAGLQGIIFLNTLATVLTLWLTYRIARALFDDEELALTAALVFGLATFAVDYAFAVWPHATANLFVAAGIYGAVMAVYGNTSSSRWSALAGVMIGLGVMVRADVILAAPVLLGWLFINLKSPGRPLLAVTMTLVVGLALSAWLNYLKFGVFNPITYGIGMGAKSAVELDGYSQYLPFAIVVGLMVLSLRWRRMQRLVKGKTGLITLAVVVVLSAVIPTSRELILKFLNGFYALVIDLRHLAAIDTHPRIERVGGEFYAYYGMLKKSLLESLPYLALSVFAVIGMFRSKRRAAYALCLVLPLVWVTPFLLREWIGGRANNLRYFSPMLPMLAILGAIGWKVIARKPREYRFWPWLTFAISLVLSLVLLYLYAENSDLLGFAHAFFVTGGAQWFGLTLLLFTLAWLVFTSLKHRLQLPLATLAQAGFVLAFVSAYAFDAVETWRLRATIESHAESLSELEPDAHVFATGQFALYFLLTRPDSTLAFFRPEDIESDLRYMEFALGEGRPVYIMTLELAREVRKALMEYGYNSGPGAIAVERSDFQVIGRQYELYRLQR